MGIKKGNAVILAVIIITLGLYLASKNDFSAIWFNSWLSVSQILSLIGVVMLSMTFWLGSRARILESLFGGMDKVMKTHHLVGGLAFVMLIHHPLLLAVSVLPNLMIAKNYLLISKTVSYNYGVLALYSMILVLIATFLIKLPYDFWLKTHDIMGVVLLLAGLHVVTISSDVSRFLPLRMWILGIIATAIFAYIYKVFLYRWLGPRYRYEVVDVKKSGDITEIIMSPLKDKISFVPGQFGVVSFGQENLKEAHPFSFSSSPQESTIRFSIKALGDYTLKLRELKKGSKAIIWGAYGRLGEKFKTNRDVVIIAGGIGITPFLSMLRDEAIKPMGRSIWLFYCTKTEEEAVYFKELSELQNKIPGFNLVTYCSEGKPRFGISQIEETVNELKDKLFLICGPVGMMESLSDQLVTSGVKRQQIRFEDFSFKP